MQNLPCPTPPSSLTARNMPRIKNFLYSSRGRPKGGVLAPKGACRQVKSVTENEPRVACKFDIEATPDMPKRIRLEGGNGDYKTKGGEREVRREGERERGHCEEGFAQGAAKVLHSFFYRFLPVSLFPLPVAFPLPLPSPLPTLPVTTPLCCSKAIAVWPPFCLAFKKHLKKHTYTAKAEGVGQAEHSGRRGGGCINNACNFANCLEMAKCFFSRASESQNATKTLGNAAGSCWINYEKYDAPTEQAERGRGPSALFANVACTLQHATPPVCPCASSRTALWVSNLIVC